MTRWERGLDGVERPVSERTVDDDKTRRGGWYGAVTLFYDEDDAARAWRDICRERERNGSRPPRAENAGRPLSRHEAQVAADNAKRSDA